MKRKFLTAAMVLAMSGCAFFRPQTPIARIAEKYHVITGVLVAPVELKNGNHRMIMYFNETPEAKVESKDNIMRDANGEIATDTEGKVVKAPETPKAASKSVLMCVATNDQNKEVLVNLQAYLNDPKAQGTLIFIYGQLVDGSWQEYLSGVHCTVNVIGFYVPTTGGWTYVMTEYGDGMWDNFSWTEFIKTIGAQAIKKAI